MMLSMPSTSSSAVNVKKAIQAWGSERIATAASMKSAMLSVVGVLAPSARRSR